MEKMKAAVVEALEVEWDEVRFKRAVFRLEFTDKVAQEMTESLREGE